VQLATPPVQAAVSGAGRGSTGGGATQGQPTHGAGRLPARCATGSIRSTVTWCSGWTNQTAAVTLGDGAHRGSGRRARGSHNEKRPQSSARSSTNCARQYRHAARCVGTRRPGVGGQLRTPPADHAGGQSRAGAHVPVMNGARMIHDLFSFPGLSLGEPRPAERGGASRGCTDRVRPTSQMWRGPRRISALIDEADACWGPRRAARPGVSAPGGVLMTVPGRMVAESGVGGFVSGTEIARRYYGDAAPEPARRTTIPTFGHVLVDEAQEPRPCSGGCWPGAADRFDDVGGRLRSGEPRRSGQWLDEVLSLIPGRVRPGRCDPQRELPDPGEIMDVAHRFLAAAGSEVVPTQAVRHTNEHPTFR